MNTSDYIVNRLIQGGIYYFELDSVSKKRPYLVISKDNGYGMNVLVFTITKQFISSKVSLPVVLNGEIGFIRISGTREVPMDKIDYGSFYGLLRPDIFSLAIRMYSSRFANVNEEELTEDIEKYLDELEEGGLTYKLNTNKVFRKADYKNNVPLVYKEEKRESAEKDMRTNTTDIKKEVNNIKLNSGPENDKMKNILEDSYWSVYRLKEFKNKCQHKSNKDLMKIFNASFETVQYLRNNIGFLISKKQQRQSLKLGK